MFKNPRKICMREKERNYVMVVMTNDKLDVATEHEEIAIIVLKNLLKF